MCVCVCVHMRCGDCLSVYLSTCVYVCVCVYVCTIVLLPCLMTNCIISLCMHMHASSL